MNKVMLALGILLACQLSAYADPEPPVGNDPVGFYEKAKELIDRSEPSGGVFYDAKSHAISGAVFVDVYEKELFGYAVAGTFGYSADKAVILGAKTDILAGISKLTGATLKIPWLNIHAGLNFGYSFENDGAAWGPSLDASVKF